MGLTQEEWRTQRVEEAHDALRGHRRAPWWPEVPKHQVDLGICETPRAHQWGTPIPVALTGRPYAVTVTICTQCPLHLTDVVLTVESEPGGNP